MDTQYKDIIADIDRLVKELVDILPDSFINKENLIGNFIRIRNFVAHHNISTTLLYNILSLIKHINTLIIEKKNYSIDDLNIIKDEIDFIADNLEDDDLSYNTVQFYIKEIENLNKQISDYKIKIDNLQKDPENKEKLILELNKANKILKEYEKELELNKKREDAINNWKVKIEEAFFDLKKPLNKLVQEHNRLKILYKIYGITSAVLVLLLITIEIIVCNKINSTIPYPNWEQYWTMILPVPVTIGLLWGFITQRNRSQRQMVVLARHIYEIEYIEGLLQALNTLSVDIGESMSKINEAISRLIDNHLRNMVGMHIDETTLQKLEKQDALPYEKIPEFIKLLKNK